MVMVNLTMPGNERKCSSCHIGPKQESKSGFINGFCARCYGKSLFNNSIASNDHPTNNVTANGGDDENEDSDSVNVIINTSDNTNKIKSLDLLWEKISMLMNKNAHSIENKLSALSNKIDFTVSCLASCDRRLDEIYQRIQSLEDEMFESDDVENEVETEHEEVVLENPMEEILEMESVMEPVMEPTIQNVIYDPEEEEDAEPEIEYVYQQPMPIDHRPVLTEVAGYAPSPYEQQAPVPAPGQPVMQIPPPGAQPAPGYVPHTHAPPPFLVPPPQFIASQTAPPNIINYVPGPNGHIFQPNYQSYSPAGVPVNLEPGPPPQEVPLYQPQGCTYYNAAQQQQQQPQPVPLRRPKAAIPILPPPENQNNRGRNRQSQSQLDQQQQEQLLQQQQQQEQLVRQQLQQRQQQLIQQQQQELQQQQEKLKQQQQQQQHQHQQQQHQPQQPEIIQYSQNDSQNIPQLSDQTTNDSRSNVIIMTDPNVNLEEKLRNVTLNETTNPNNEDQTLEVTEVEVSTRKKELVSTGIVESDHVEEKLGISAAQTIETDKTSISTGEKSELDCVVQDSTVINKAAA